MKSMYCLAAYITAVILVEVGKVEFQQNQFSKINIHVHCESNHRVVTVISR